MWLIILLLFVLLLALVGLVLSINGLIRLLTDRVPYVPTRYWAIDWMVAHLEFKDDTVVYDLGAGDGRILASIKKKFPKVTAIGYERSWWPYLLWWWRYRKSGVDMRGDNFYHGNFVNANIIFCFLMTSIMPKVETMLRSQVRPGTTIVCYGFPFPNWQPTEVVTNPDRPRGSKLFIYKT